VTIAVWLAPDGSDEESNTFTSLVVGCVGVALARFHWGPLAVLTHSNVFPSTNLRRPTLLHASPARMTGALEAPADDDEKRKAVKPAAIMPTIARRETLSMGSG
jgi:hypothetical protein